MTDMDVPDIKRMIMSFVDITDIYKGIWVLRLTLDDIRHYLSLQDLSIHSKDELKRLILICHKYGRIRRLSFLYEPEDKIDVPLARSVSASFVWKGMGLMNMVRFVHSQCGFERMDIKIIVNRNWDFGVLSNVLDCQNPNLYLFVEGHPPLYKEEIYLNTPCRMTNLEISTKTVIETNVLDKIRRLTDHLTVVTLP